VKLVRVLNALSVLGVVLGLAVALEGVQVLAALRNAQLTLDGAAARAATAVDVERSNGFSVATLRLEDRDNHPSAFTLAREYIQLAGLDETLVVTGIFDDGGTVYVQGQVRISAVLGRVIGDAQYELGLVSEATRNP
jgi:hypothetical protein